MGESKTLALIYREGGDIASLIEEAEGVITPEIEAAFDQNSLEEADKADRISFARQGLQSKLELAKNYIAQMKKIKESAERGLENLDNYVLQEMIKNNREELAGSQCVFKVQLNPPACIIEEHERIPGEFIISETVISVDKKAIADAIKGGRDIPGARLERGTRLVHKIGPKRLERLYEQADLARKRARGEP